MGTTEATLMSADESQQQAAVARGASRRAEDFSRFAAGVAARINTPLAIVSGWLQLLGNDHAANSALADKLRLIKAEADCIAETTSQLLAFAVQAAPRHERVDAGRLLSELASVCALRCRKKGVRVSTDIAANAPAVSGDEDQLRQALDALAQHSETALHQGCTLEIILRPTPNGVEAVLRDDGPMIPAGRLRGLFEPFAPTRASQYDGLSLAIARAIIRNHGGKIAASSDATPRTQFVIWLPARDRGPLAP
jgi:signal transduction histidine kinase